MGLETGTYINSLNASNPLGTDAKSAGDDHIRLLKSTIKATFPNLTGAVTADQGELNKLDGVTATTAELNKLAGLTPTTTELNYVAGVTSAIQTQLNAVKTTIPSVGSLTAGEMAVLTAGATLNTGEAAGTVLSIYNDSAASITITQGSGLTLRLAGTTSTGTRTIAPRGMASVWCKSTTEYIMSGPGVA